MAQNARSKVMSAAQLLQSIEDSYIIRVRDYNGVMYTTGRSGYNPKDPDSQDRGLTSDPFLAHIYTSRNCAYVCAWKLAQQERMKWRTVTIVPLKLHYGQGTVIERKED